MADVASVRLAPLELHRELLAAQRIEAERFAGIRAPRSARAICAPCQITPGL